jgi:hypothetical protein
MIPDPFASRRVDPQLSGVGQHCGAKLLETLQALVTKLLYAGQAVNSILCATYVCAGQTP